MQIALADPAVMQRLSDLGAEPLPNTQPQFVRLIESERKRWGDVIRNANIRVE
jgi:tripartite-type tricarboxylate transporter receptor subunit TctC